MSDRKSLQIKSQAPKGEKPKKFAGRKRRKNANNKQTATEMVQSTG